jgi:NAD(P)-dependent dehydrogenase (short-subunit alcohol dehydrogenase family)
MTFEERNDYMDKKICIITGANSGIGKESAIKIAREGYHVILACRSKERGEKALSEVINRSNNGSAELMLLDLSLRSSTENFANEIKERFKRIDVLIHNAAIFDISQKEVVITKEGYEAVWMTNHINPVYLTYQLLELLKASDNGKIINISSKGLLAMPFLKVNLKDPEFKNRKFNMTKAYYQSKRAQVMWTYYLAKELNDSHITVNAIRVPAVKIDISRHPDISTFTKWIYKQKSKQSISPVDMADAYTYLATSSEVNCVTGKYFNEKNEQVNSSDYSKYPGNIEDVMNLTKQYLV